MSRQWYIRLVFLVLFFTMVVTLYTMLESISTNLDERQKTNQQWINDHLDSLEDSIRNLDKIIKEENRKQGEELISFEYLKSKFKINWPIQTNLTMNLSKNIMIKNNCIWQNSTPINTTFQFRQLYDNLSFNNQNNIISTEYFDIQYNSSQWTEKNKLKIILMPHSHCDPGWLNTFELYFYRRTVYIINTIIEILNRNKNYRFIWNEISFLSLWWDHATYDQRQLLKKLVYNKQLEIVTGGWVMNDEANTHYYSMLDQLIEGHQFIDNKLGNITIQSSWANDPFGYSPTMAYLLQASGIKYMAIHRVHYDIKKALGKKKHLEFRWYQTWDRNNSTQIFTHILPFYAYDIPHTCGPDPKICCQFDFKRGTSLYPSCPWGIDPQPITGENIQERSQLLLDQYRKKAQLYRTNVLFIQLGDDFRYTSIHEAKLQFENYDALFTYMNQRIDWNVHIQYGTLSDYFEHVLQENSIEKFPSYVGDFFTYADHSDNYWSGYYTSRPFFKRMNRIAESYLRAAEILFSIVRIKIFEQQITNYFPEDNLFTTLIIARRNLGIFQHHDAITGTAKQHVVNDYGKKLLNVILISQNIMQQSASYLLFRNHYSFNNQFLESNQQFQTFQSLPIRKLILFNNEQENFRIIYIYNPTDKKRIEIIKILLNTYQIYVTSNDQLISTCQIDPKWSDKRSSTIDQNQFQLLILVDIDPYSIKEYTIHITKTQQSCPLTTIKYIKGKQMINNSSGPFKMTPHEEKFIEINNRFLSILFSKTGNILHIQHKKLNEKIRFHTNIIHYGTLKDSNHHSGAYIFIPNGNARDIPINDYNFIRIQQGPLINRIDIIHNMYGLQYKLTNTNSLNDYIIEFSTITHLNMDKDIELAIRFSTGIKNEAEFFTDLNGFQMIRRKTYDKLPIQGNVYPMATMMYIEGDNMRFNILAAQPSGVACLKSGVIDIFLDRRLTRDDGRGLGEGVMDNREIISTFKLLFEPHNKIIDRISLTGYPTLLAHHLSIEFLYSLHIFHSSISKIYLKKLNFFFQSLYFSNDYHLINLRTLNDNNQNNDIYRPSKNFALILRRFAYDCNENYDNLFHIKPTTFEYFFQENQIKSIEQTTLSLRHIKQQLNITSKLNIPYAEIATYRIQLN